MPVCVECGKSVPNLYTEYSKQNIQLSVCVCKNLLWNINIFFLNIFKILISFVNISFLWLKLIIYNRVHVIILRINI